MSAGAVGQRSGRHVVLWVPNWSLSSLVVQVPVGAPAVVFRKDRVYSLTPAARANGIRLGMSKKGATYLCPDLLVFPDDPERDHAAFETVLEVFDQLAVGVTTIKPGLAFAPAHSASKWLGGEEKLVSSLIENVASITGAESQVGIGTGLATAVLAAREGQIVPLNKTTKFLATRQLKNLVEGLPLKDMKPVEEVLQTLKTLGVQTVSQYVRLGSDAIVSRFGTVGELLLDLAVGKDPLLSSTDRHAPEIKTETRLDPPAMEVEHAFIAARLAGQELVDKLVNAGLYSSTLVVALEHENGDMEHRTWGLFDLTSPSEVTRRIVWQLRAVGDKPNMLPTGEPGSPLVAIHLQALSPQTRPDAMTLWGGNQTLQLASKTVNEIQTLLGDEAIKTPQVHGGFDPRTRVSLMPWGATSDRHPPKDAPWDGGVSPSPVVVFARPLPTLLVGENVNGTVGQIKVDGRGNLTGRPSHLVVQSGHPELAAGSYAVASVEAMWPVRGRWWNPTDPEHTRRCYLRISHQDGPDLLLVLKEGEWRVEGVYPATRPDSERLRSPFGDRT